MSHLNPNKGKIRGEYKRIKYKLPAHGGRLNETKEKKCVTNVSIVTRLNHVTNLSWESDSWESDS